MNEVNYLNHPCYISFLSIVLHSRSGARHICAEFWTGRLNKQTGHVWVKRLTPNWSNLLGDNLHDKSKPTDLEKKIRKKKITLTCRLLNLPREW